MFKTTHDYDDITIPQAVPPFAQGLPPLSSFHLQFSEDERQELLYI